MRKMNARPTGEVTSTLVFHHLIQVQAGCLAMGGILASLSLFSWIGHLPQWVQMTGTSALSALAGTVGLVLTLPGVPRRMTPISRIAAIAVLAPIELELLQNPGHRWWLWGAGQAGTRETYAHTPVALQFAFVLLAIALFFLRSRTGWRSFIADGAAFVLCFAVLIGIWQYLMGSTSIYGKPDEAPTSLATLSVLMLLSFVAFGRRAEYGMGAILIGGGIGSRIARAVAPVLIAIPFLREAARAWILRSRVLPEHLMVAILASIAAMVSLGLLIFVSWRIEGMEEEIRDLGLRDELTGLYNLRGFRLLAEQALLMARRSQAPFAVLFIDMDNLKQINDQLGHRAGSAYISKAGEILRDVFRDSDVVGRIGGDEFAVAGQFSQAAITIAISRLERQVKNARLAVGADFPLSLSTGYVSSDEYGCESLQELLDGADAAMYEVKRSKKVPTD